MAPCGALVRTATRRSSSICYLRLSKEPSSWRAIPKNYLPGSGRRDSFRRVAFFSSSSTSTEQRQTLPPSPFEQRKTILVPTQSNVYKETHNGIGSDGKSPDEWERSIFDMDAERIQKQVRTADELEDLVDQLEQLPTLTPADLHTLIKPLLNVCKRLGKDDRAADLAERILFCCMAHLPPDLESRYTQWEDDRHLESNNASLQTTTRTRRLPPLLYPDANAYAKVMITCGNPLTPEAADRVQRLFRLMVAEYRSEARYVATLNQQQEDNGMVRPPIAVRAPAPSAAVYKSLLRVMALCGTQQGTMEAERILRDMEIRSGLTDAMGETLEDQRANDDDPPIGWPDLQCYNMVLSSYSRLHPTHYPRAMPRAQALFQRMVQLEETTNNDHSRTGTSAPYMMDWYSYQAILHCFQRYIHSMENARNSLDEDTAEHILAILRAMHSIRFPVRVAEPGEGFNTHPLAWAYGIYVKAMLRTSPLTQERMQKAHDLVLAMVQQDAHPDLPMRTGHNSSYSKVDMLPSLSTILEVLKGWHSIAPFSETSGNIQNLERIAVEVLPQHYTSWAQFHDAMQFWKQSGWKNAPFMVQSMLGQTLEPDAKFSPSGQTFAFAMWTWMESTRPEAPLRIQALYHDMNRRFEEHNDERCAPNEVHIDLLLGSWTRHCHDGKRHEGYSGNHLYAAQHMTELLRGLPSRFDFRNFRHYATTLKAWARQFIDPNDKDRPNPVKEAYRLFVELEEQSRDKALVRLSNMVLETCARFDYSTVDPKTMREAREIAKDLFFDRPGRDPYTFVLAAEAFKRTSQNPNDVDTLMLLEQLFRECCAEGMLTQSLILEIVEIADEEMLQKLFFINEPIAKYIIRLRPTALRREKKKLFWPSKPRDLEIVNLPREWSRSSELGHKIAGRPLRRSSG